MLLIAGLGNPGAKYENNRHNVGFMAADAIARRHGFSPWSKKFHALACDGRINDQKTLLLKPLGFMNLSGQAVGEAMRFHKLTPSDVIVIYDELDLAPGKMRVKTGGGAGGHNGVRSLDQHIGKDYRRVRIGIGHPGVKELVTNHVLGDFAKADREWLDPMLEAIADAIPLLAAGDEGGFMNKVSLAAPGARKEPAGEAASAKGRSHVRQARPQQPQMRIPETGPMAAMLRRLFGKD
jgi:PTH1 family peptidyl-tRNA hydrolase